VHDPPENPDILGQSEQWPITVDAKTVGHLRQVQNMTAMRGWIINSFAQVEFVLLDMVLQMRRFEEYDAYAEKRPPFGLAERVDRVRTYCGLPGPLASHGAQIRPILDGFEEMSEDRHFLTHGFCIYVYTDDGDAGLRFRRFAQGKKGQSDELRTKTFRPAELEAFRRHAVEFTTAALGTFANVYRDLGLSDPDPESPILL
jgi:hypothetical protein